MRSGGAGNFWLFVLSEMQRAIFLDRDGVLIRNIVRDGRPYGITDGEPAIIIDGVEDACAALSGLGFLLVMVTNQPDVATGRTSRRFVEVTNADLARKLHLHDVQVCFHDDGDGCDCRKPKPGMILNVAAKLNIDLPASIMVGDRWRDIEAGKRAGCRTVLIDYGYLDRQAPPSDHVAASLFAAVEWIRGIA